MMKTASKFLLFIFFTAGLFSCEKYVIKPEVVLEVHFAADIQPIFVSRCSGCHPGTVEPDFTDGNVYTALTTYDGGALLDTETPENSYILTKVSDGHSYNDVSAGQKSKILKWIENGAPND